MKLYTCPCCGYKVFSEPPGSYQICPVCNWEDDLSQLRFVNSLGANHISLIDAQKKYLAKKSNNKDYEKDLAWQIFDENKFKIEAITEDKEYGETYPEDSTDFYYWKK